MTPFWRAGRQYPVPRLTLPPVVRKWHMPWRHASTATTALSPGRNERGQDLIEYALIAPIFFLLFLGIIEFSLIVWTYDTLASVAREGARYGIVPSHTQAQVDTYATSRALGLSNRCTNDIVTVSVFSASTVRVEATCTFELLSGPMVQAFGGNPQVTLHATSVMNRE
jgi:Flp pilus assembly protein TadG